MFVCLFQQIGEKIMQMQSSYDALCLEIHAEKIKVLKVRDWALWIGEGLCTLKLVGKQKHSGEIYENV